MSIKVVRRVIQWYSALVLPIAILVALYQLRGDAIRGIEGLFMDAEAFLKPFVDKVSPGGIIPCDSTTKWVILYALSFQPHQAVEEWVLFFYSGFCFLFSLLYPFRMEIVMTVAYICIRVGTKLVLWISSSIIGLFWSGFAALYTKRRKRYGKEVIGNYAILWTNMLELKRFFLVKAITDLIRLADITFVGTLALLYVRRAASHFWGIELCDRIIEFIAEQKTIQVEDTFEIYGIIIYLILRLVRMFVNQIIGLRLVMMIIQYPDVCLVTLPTVGLVLAVYACIFKKENDRIRITNIINNNISNNQSITMQTYNQWFIDIFSEKIFAFEAGFKTFVSRGLLGGIAFIVRKARPKRLSRLRLLCHIFLFPTISLLYLPIAISRYACLMFTIPVKVRVKKSLGEGTPFWIVQPLEYRFKFFGKWYQEEDGFIFNTTEQILNLLVWFWDEKIKIPKRIYDPDGTVWIRKNWRDFKPSFAWFERIAQRFRGGYEKMVAEEEVEKHADNIIAESLGIEDDEVEEEIELERMVGQTHEEIQEGMKEEKDGYSVLINRGRAHELAGDKVVEKQQTGSRLQFFKILTRKAELAADGSNAANQRMVEEKLHEYHAVPPPPQILMENEKRFEIKIPKEEMVEKAHRNIFEEGREEVDPPQGFIGFELGPMTNMEPGDLLKTLPVRLTATEMQGIVLKGRYENAHKIPNLPLDYNQHFFDYIALNYPPMIEPLKKSIIIAVNPERTVKAITRWRVRQTESILDPLRGKNTGLNDFEWVSMGLDILLKTTGKTYAVRDPREVSEDWWSPESLGHFPGRGPKLQGYNTKGEAFHSQKQFLIRNWNSLLNGFVPKHEWALIPVPKVKGKIKENDYEYECRTAVCPDLWFSNWTMCLLKNLMDDLTQRDDSPLKNFNPFHGGFNDRVKRLLRNYCYYESRDTKDHGPSMGKDMYDLLEYWLKKKIRARADMEQTSVETMLEANLNETRCCDVVLNKEAGGYVFSVKSGWKDGQIYTSQIDGICALIMDLIAYKKTLDSVDSETVDSLKLQMGVATCLDLLRAIVIEAHGDNLVESKPNAYNPLLAMRSGLQTWKKLGYFIKENEIHKQIFDVEMMGYKIDQEPYHKVFVGVRDAYAGLRCLSYPRKMIGSYPTPAQASYLLSIINCAFITERWNFETLAILDGYRQQILSSYPDAKPDYGKIKFQMEQMGLKDVMPEMRFITEADASFLWIDDKECVWYSQRHGGEPIKVVNELKRDLLMLESERKKLRKFKPNYM